VTTTAIAAIIPLDSSKTSSQRYVNRESLQTRLEAQLWNENAIYKDQEETELRNQRDFDEDLPNLLLGV
jgi:hypothetical protein